MQRCRSRLILLLVCLACPSSESLVIHKRSADSDEVVTDRQLLNAIEVIERAKLQRQGVGELEDDEDEEETENFREPSNELAEEFIPVGELSAQNEEILEDLLDSSLEAERLQGDDDGLRQKEIGLGGGREGDENEDEMEGVGNLPNIVEEKRPVKKEELDDIFKLSPPVGAREEAQTSNTVRVVPLSEKKKIFQTEVGDVVEKVSEISGGTASPDIDVVNVHKVVTSETEPRTGKTIVKTETTDFTADPPNKVINVDVKEGKDISPALQDVINKEWITDLVQQSDFGDEDEDYPRIRTKKSKRSEPSLSSAATTTEQEDENLKHKAINLLKTYIEQQDEENRHLTRALKLATANQVQENDENIANEIEEIKAAVKNEQLLQAVRDTITAADEGQDAEGRGEEEDDDEEELEPRQSKRILRSDIVVDEYEPEELWLPAEEDDNNERERVIDGIIRDRVGQYLLESSNNDADADNELILESSLSLSNNEPSESDETDGYRLNPFLREVTRTNNFETPKKRPFTKEDSGQGCSSIDDLVDDCLVAKRRDLLLDNEATELCNRHQLCYACGSYYGMSARTCDRAYIGEADLACSGMQDKEKCHIQALELYLLLFHHRSYTEDTVNYQCTEKCIYNYISG